LTALIERFKLPPIEQARLDEALKKWDSIALTWDVSGNLTGMSFMDRQGYVLFTWTFTWSGSNLTTIKRG